MLSFKQFITEMPRLLQTYNKDRNRIHYSFTDKGNHLATLDSGHEIYKKKVPLGYIFTAHDPSSNTDHIRVLVDENKTYHQVEGLEGHPESTIKAHQFYHALLKHGAIKELRSSVLHSIGGKKTWERLSKYPDINIKHAVNISGEKLVMKKGKSFDQNYQNERSIFKATLKSQKKELK